ncbi:MAG: hypothetical protein K6G87_02530 [Butyrivibrio sp.]|nr:hypothetical protein [Butyrivibrio sp.]
MNKKTDIYIDKLYKDDLPLEYCQVAVPFKRGELSPHDADSFTVSSDNICYQTQSKVTASWDDGSVKYLFVRFLADIKGNSNTHLVLSGNGHLGKESEKDIQLLEISKGNDQLAARNNTDSKKDIDTPKAINKNILKVNMGRLLFTLSDNGSYLFESLKYGDITYSSEDFEGPVLKLDGMEMPIKYGRWNIVEKGPVCAIFENEARYSDECRCVIRLTAIAGKPYVDISVRLFNDSDKTIIPDSFNMYIKRPTVANADNISSKNNISIKNSISINDNKCTKEAYDGNSAVASEEAKDLFYQTTGTGSLTDIENTIRDKSVTGIRTMTGISNYKTRFTISGNGAKVGNSVNAPFLVSESNEHFAEVFYGTFFADTTDSNGGVCATIFQAQQNFPKEIAADSDKVTISLIPEGDEKVVFSSGMAREQRFLLHFHDKDEPISEIDNRSLIYQMPVSAHIDPEIYGQAEVFPSIVTNKGYMNDNVEIAMIDRADGHGRAYGMMNFGDFPDSNYTAQGRGGGKLVWTNNEYDYPHAMFMMYVRTGVRRFLDYGIVAARHWMDVDICHYSSDPLKIGGQWEHTNGHNGGSEDGNGPKGEMVCSHEWVEGLLDLWHFTGDRRALETALNIGENVLRLLDTPMYQKPGEASARETGWALRTLTALYLETYDAKWVQKSEWIVDQFKQWNIRYGAWLSPYTDNTVIRVGFMISVALGSLMRYYRVFPDTELRKLMLDAIDDLCDNFMTPHGIFYYKELPSLNRNGTNTLLLEAMYIGYELTGDIKYLKNGLRTFNNAMRNSPSYNGNKQIKEDAVLVGTTSPKGFAQSFLPLILFYNAAAKNGLLKD